MYFIATVCILSMSTSEMSDSIYLDFHPSIFEFSSGQVTRLYVGFWLPRIVLFLIGVYIDLGDCAPHEP